MDGIESGGAPAFLDFLTTELRTWIAERYNVIEDTTLVSESMGGLFATYVLLHEPAPFDRCVIGSPWLCWNDTVSTGYEAD